MAMSLTKAQEKAIRDYVLQDVDDETKRLIRLANWDLYYGPVTEPDDSEPWPGFIAACRQIRDALDVGTLYIDAQTGNVNGVKPDIHDCLCGNPDCDMSMSEVEPEDVLRIVVGRELAPYIR